jgi:hypothetical protein
VAEQDLDRLGAPACAGVRLRPARLGYDEDDLICMERWLPPGI